MNKKGDDDDAFGDSESEEDNDLSSTRPLIWRSEGMISRILSLAQGIGTQRNLMWRVPSRSSRLAKLGRAGSRILGPRHPRRTPTRKHDMSPNSEP